MSRFACIWELGANYGHLASFSHLVQELLNRGHEVSLAMRELSDLPDFFDIKKVRVFQTPIVDTGKYAPPVSVTYADLIAPYGFGSNRGLYTLMRAWDELFSVMDPELIICNASPGALLFARGLSCKRVTLGTGYHTPPKDEKPLPSIRPWVKVSKGDIADREKHMVSLINQVVSDFGQDHVNKLGDLFATDHDFLCTYEETDHYERKGGSYYGPMYSETLGAKAEWPAGKGKRVFVYMRPSSQHFVPLMETLAKLSHAVLVAAPGLSDEAIKKLSKPNLKIVSGSLQMADIFPACDAVVTNAGHGTTSAALLHGIPCLLLPDHPEQAIMALHVKEIGAALVPPFDQQKLFYKPLLSEVLSNPAYRQAAQAFKQKYADFSQSIQIQQICNKLEELT